MKRTLQSALIVTALAMTGSAAAQEDDAGADEAPTPRRADPSNRDEAVGRASRTTRLDAVTYPPVPADVPVVEARPPLRRAIGGAGRLVLDLVGGEGSTAGVGALGAAGAAGMFGAFVGPLSFSASSTATSGPALTGDFVSTSYTRVSLAPSLDVFVSDRLSIGGRASVTWVTASSQTPPWVSGPHTSTRMDSTGVAVVPRIGYAFPLSTSFALWPRVGAGVESTSTARDGFNYEMRTYLVEANLGLIARVSEHLLLDLGPSLTARAVTGPAYDGTHLDVGGRAALRLDF